MRKKTTTTQHYVCLLKFKDNRNNNRNAMDEFRRNKKEKGMKLPQKAQKEGRKEESKTLVSKTE